MGKRLVFTVAESTGKTSMVKSLGAEYNIPFTEEFARNYLESKGGSFYLEHEVLRMAIGQHNDILDHSSQFPYLFCDTDLLTFLVWKDFKYGIVDIDFLELFQASKGHHYLLFAPDIPWEPDPLREHPNSRWEIHTRYLHFLKEFKLDFTLVSGETMERKKICRKTIRNFLEL